MHGLARLVLAILDDGRPPIPTLLLPALLYTAGSTVIPRGNPNLSGSEVFCGCPPPFAPQGVPPNRSLAFGCDCHLFQIAGSDNILMNTPPITGRAWNPRCRALRHVYQSVMGTRG